MIIPLVIDTEIFTLKSTGLNQNKNNSEHKHFFDNKRCKTLQSDNVAIRNLRLDLRRTMNYY